MARPIGYWLKHLDTLIETTFERTLDDVGLARRHWQAMNALHERPLSPSELAEALRPFWTDDAISLDEVLRDLEGRGWVTRDAAGACALSTAGRDAHGDVSARVAETRRHMADGLTVEEYQTTVRTLERMATNLERAAAR